MRHGETTWLKNSDWKARYSRLYSSRCITLPQEEDTGRISFMSNDSTPYQNLLMRSHQNSLVEALQTQGTSPGTPEYTTSILSQRSDPYSCFSRSRSVACSDDTLGGHATMLLDMVRAQSKDSDGSQDKTIELPKEEESDDESSEACMHGLTRFTDHSVSRSRFSRISSKRDMDIPTILAFTTDTTAPVPLAVPGFQRLSTPRNEEIPRWSIRRSICPVCSQKWRDRSAIHNVKYSGLKRNSSSELPTVIAPARLRAAITMAYVPRPTLAMVDENVPGYRLLRNTSATWQLTRARRFRTPKLQLPPPEARAPPSAAAPLARKDLDIRVNKFLSKPI